MQISAGTVSVTYGSATVTKNGTTNWAGIVSGSLFCVQGDAVFYIVAQYVPGVGQPDTVTLSAPYRGATNAQALYAIVNDFTPNYGLPLINRGDLETATIYDYAMAKLDFLSTIGGGDMYKATYDTADRGYVDRAVLADTAPWSGLIGVPATMPPSAHAPSHLSTGSDPIATATSSHTGLMARLSGVAGQYYDGLGHFTVPPGMPLVIKGTVPTAASLPTTGQTKGDIWIALDTSHGWSWTGTSWVDIGPLQAGPPGPVGNPSNTTTGAAFTVPPVGQTVTVAVNDPSWMTLGEMVWVANAAGGSNAAILEVVNISGPNVTLLNPSPTVGTGPQGPPGQPGSAATISVGPTTTLAPGNPATVTNTGTPSTAVFDFGIPAGATGAQGLSGPQGVPGQGYTWRSTWSATIAYNVYDTVFYAGSSYVCVQAHTNSVPPSGYWNVLAQVGGVGPMGPPGYTSAHSTLAAVFTMPAVNATATAQLVTGGAGNFSVGAIAYVSPVGYLAITGLNTSNDTLTLQNMGYGVNQAPGSTAPLGNSVTGTGPQGPPGNNGATGPPGTTPTVAVGTTTTLAPGTAATVTDTGSPSAAVFNFGIPAGQAGVNGAQGNPGSPATIAIGTTTTLAPGANATVTDTGTPSAAVFNFGIPAGTAGATGGVGPPGTAGAPGTPGLNAFNTTSGGFTVPPVGQSVTVTLVDASWVVVGQLVYVDQAGGGPGQAGALQVTAKTGNQVTFLNPSPPTPAIPVAGPTQAGLVNPLSGNATDYIGGDNASHALAAEVLAVTPLASGTTKGLLAQLNGQPNSYVGGDNACHPLSFASGFIAKTAAYTLTTADSGKYILCSGNGWTLTLPAAQSGLVYYLRNDQGLVAAGTITLQPQTGSLINGLSSINLLPAQECTLITDGTNWRTFGLQREVVIGTQDITSSVASAFVLLPVGYRCFELYFNGMTPVTNAAQFLARLSMDGGNTWGTANYYNGIILNTTASVVAASDAENSTSFWLCADIATGLNSQTKVTLYPGSASKMPTALVTSGGRGTTFNICWAEVFSLYDVIGIANGFQYFASAGNIASAFLTVKGIV